jgi:hypothetical protein
MIVPGGGFSLDGSKRLPCRPRFLFAVEVLSQLFRRSTLQRGSKALYTQVASNTIREVMSPLDRLTPLMAEMDESKHALAA